MPCRLYTSSSRLFLTVAAACLLGTCPALIGCDEKTTRNIQRAANLANTLNDDGSSNGPSINDARDALELLFGDNDAPPAPPASLTEDVRQLVARNFAYWLRGSRAFDLSDSRVRIATDALRTFHDAEVYTVMRVPGAWPEEADYTLPEESIPFRVLSEQEVARLPGVVYAWFSIGVSPEREYPYRIVFGIDGSSPGTMPLVHRYRFDYNPTPVAGPAFHFVGHTMLNAAIHD